MIFRYSVVADYFLLFRHSDDFSSFNCHDVLSSFDLVSKTATPFYTFTIPVLGVSFTSRCN